MRKVVCVSSSYWLRAQYFCIDFVGVLVPEVLKQPRVVQMNFGVHDDSVDTILLEHVFGILEQSNPSTALTEFFPEKIYVFKGGLAGHIV
jgi:hypothetical protein